MEGNLFAPQIKITKGDPKRNLPDVGEIIFLIMDCWSFWFVSWVSWGFQDPFSFTILVVKDSTLWHHCGKICGIIRAAKDYWLFWDSVGLSVAMRVVELYLTANHPWDSSWRQRPISGNFVWHHGIIRSNSVTAWTPIEALLSTTDYPCSVICSSGSLLKVKLGNRPLLRDQS